MSELVPFMSGALPAYLQGGKAQAAVNKDVVTAQQFPELKIKGKVFALSKDNVKTPLMVDFDGDKIPAPSVQINVLRVNKRSRVYYADSYVEGESDGLRPTCFSFDGIAPSEFSVKKQAEKCQICPQAVWGTKQRDDGSAGEGTACSPVTRLAVSTPDKLNEPYLLRVPAGSRKNFDDAVKLADARSVPYNALVFKVSFDPEAPSPKLVFKPVALLDEAQFAEATKQYESELVRSICGLVEQAALPAPVPSTAPELDAALAQRAAQGEASTPAAPVVKATAQPAVKAAAPAATAVAKPAPAPAAPAAGMDDLLHELGSLLGDPADDA